MLLCLPLGVGCAALDEFEHVMEDEATIPGTIMMAGPFSLGYNGGFNDVRLSQEQSFQNAGVTPDDVDAIFVQEVHIEAKNPQIDRLDVILDSIELYVAAEGEPTLTIATARDLAPMTTALDLTVDRTVNLKPYAVKPSMRVGANLVLKQKPLFETTLETTIRLLIDINLLGS